MIGMETKHRGRLRVAVIGGGPAGMTAAAEAALLGAAVTLYEKNPQLGKKLSITGKGRCNVTNDCPTDEFFRAVTSNPRFLYSAVNGFTSADTKALFEGLGVPLKTERGQRVFPVSDNAHDIVNALAGRLHDAGVTVRHETVTGLAFSEPDRDGNRTIAGVSCSSGTFPFDRVIVCTGGLSYPGTGSTGDGYRFARSAGHTVTPLSPSLVPLVCAEPFCAEMMGLSLKNTALTVTRGESPKVLYSDFGEMLFTHFGVSGPMILSASAHLDRNAASEYVLHLDLKPALDVPTLDARLLRDFSASPNRDFGNAAGGLLPAKMIPPAARLAGIPTDEKCNAITKEQRKRLISVLKDFVIHVRAFRPVDEAIVTAGGVSVKEVSPKTMESKRVHGLYFAGEVLDVDACTGGFNLQIAFSTAVAAGRAAAAE